METYKLYNGQIELKFDNTSHMYTVNDKVVYGVTSAVGVLNKPALLYWAVNMAVEYLDANLTPGMVIDEVNKTTLLSEAKKAHRNILSTAADIGTAVHEYLEQYIKAGVNKQPLPAMPVNPQIRKGVEALLAWTKKNKVKFISSERKVYSKKYQYAGTLDAEIQVNGGELGLIDFKTSSGIYSEMLIQTAAYAKALEEEAGKKYKHIWILRMPKDGSMFGSAKNEHVDLYFKSFLGCLDNYRRVMWEKANKIQELKVKLNGNV